MEPKSKCAYTGCTRNIYDENGKSVGKHCIFHATHKNGDRFYQSLQEEIKKQKESERDYLFDGFIFPDKHATKVNSQSRANHPFVGFVFDRRVIFTNITFHGFANFSEVVFRADAHFINVVFARGCSFETASFDKKAVFEKTCFFEKMDFRYCSFAVLGDFSDCSLIERVRFIWPGDGLKRIGSGIAVPRGTLRMHRLCLKRGLLDMRDNSLASDCELILSDCDLSHILLVGTNCTQIVFRNPWHSEWIWGRPVIGDEWLPRRRSRLRQSLPAHNANGLHFNTRGYQLFRHFHALLRLPFLLRKTRLKLFIRLQYTHPRPLWERIAITYQELAKNAHDQFSHSLANSYTRGVFAMRRITIPNQTTLGRIIWATGEAMPQTCAGLFLGIFRRRALLLIKNICSLPALFYYASLYGGSVLLPFLWLVVFTAIFGGLYEWLIYNGYPSFTNPVFPVNGLVSALRIVGLNRTWLIDALNESPNELFVTILANVQVVITAIFVTLLLFAVRRRFKHGD